MLPERFIRSTVGVTFSTLSLWLSPMSLSPGVERPTFALNPEFLRRGGRVLRTSRPSQSAQFVPSEPNARCA